MAYVKRLFTKRFFGGSEGSNGSGATVCAEQRELMHSTDDMRCGALFRIKNVATSTITWKVNWHFTGWSGWGGRASCAVRRRGVWSGSCHGNCNRDDNFQIPANSEKNRVSTVIFMAGSAYPYGHYNHHRVVSLGFNNLALPTNLEFIDDMGTVKSSDRWDA